MDDQDFEKPLTEQDDAKLAQQTQARIADLESQLANSQTLLADALGSCLRARADGENTKRRVEEDARKAHKFAIFNFAESMIPIKDSLEMALMHDTPSAELMKEGIELTLKQLCSAFQKNGVVEIIPVRGDKIDPLRHQAVALVACSTQDANTVVTVLQKGYMMADRLLRPAIVTAAQQNLAL